VINATIKRQEGQDVIVDLGKAEGRMPKKEQSRLESFAPGERARVVIVRVEKASKGPQVVVSRAVPELVSICFQTEVPEIYDNTLSFGPLPAKLASVPRSRSCRRTRMSIRWALVSG